MLTRLWLLGSQRLLSAYSTTVAAKRLGSIAASTFELGSQHRLPVGLAELHQRHTMASAEETVPVAAPAADAAPAAEAAAPAAAAPKEKKEKAPKEKKEKPKKEPKAEQADGKKGAAGGAGDSKGLGLKNSKKDNFGEWYSELVVASELISYYDVSGCYILRPWAYAMWEVVQGWFDKRIKQLGVQNSYFPLFITEDVLNTEKDHVEGFAPEVAWVTKYGNSTMEKPIAIRPTSETVMYPYFAQWIRSHRDLPLRLNQWTNVVRWEFKYPTPFIRSREFLWQEGHTAFATQEEAEQEVLDILELYRGVYEDVLAVPVTKGKKSKKEQFAGAFYTTTVEAYIPETGRGIQGATSHCLGQNFSKMFSIQFEDDDRQKQYVWQNSWGLTTRSLGVMIMTHADDKGLVLPPRVAPKQVVIIPIPKANTPPETVQAMMDKVTELTAALEKEGVRVVTDTRTNYTPGWKYNQWELKGLPLRMELGPKDMENSAVVLARRDTGAKETVGWADVAARVPALLETIQADMFAAAKGRTADCTEVCHSFEEFMAALNNKHMALTPWADEEEIEEEVKKKSTTPDAMGAKTLCLPFEAPPLPEGTKCFYSGKPAKNWALWGRSY
ncbi:hypothetical protein PLESTB_000502900 [Pleodorina starrii]|uniref:proline--tRNA ligase n=1 Tax=Pleodorina starrii TaxID=330485 RepID=A0A9W6BGN9_9CHLO|nr:hypothetical protein PLESTM_001773600 [Pleodorina starrii]GLC51443.1 hypothetical protein PLESTB_000502900 [Pleodorina starrii]GLC67739.1 hypothetical protein PLESTF_000600500 [Pleodorina starrii]